MPPSSTYVAEPLAGAAPVEALGLPAGAFAVAVSAAVLACLELQHRGNTKRARVEPGSIEVSLSHSPLCPPKPQQLRGHGSVAVPVAPCSCARAQPRGHLGQSWAPQPPWEVMQAGGDNTRVPRKSQFEIHLGNFQTSQGVSAMDEAFGFHHNAALTPSLQHKSIENLSSSRRGGHHSRKAFLLLGQPQTTLPGTLNNFQLTNFNVHKTTGST